MFSFCSLDVKSAVIFSFPGKVYELLSAILYLLCKFPIFPLLTDYMSLRLYSHIVYISYSCNVVCQISLEYADYFPTFSCNLLEYVLLLTIPESSYDWLYQV